jgi:hypothetical protein
MPTGHDDQSVGGGPPVSVREAAEILEKHRTLSRDNAYALLRPAQRAALVEVERELLADALAQVDKRLNSAGLDDKPVKLTRETLEELFAAIHETEGVRHVDVIDQGLGCLEITIEADNAVKALFAATKAEELRPAIVAPKYHLRAPAWCWEDVSSLDIRRHNECFEWACKTLQSPKPFAAPATGTVDIERCSAGIVDVLDSWRHEHKTIHEVPTYTTVRVVPPEEL